MMVRTLVCFGDSNTHGSLPMRDLTDLRRVPAGRRWPTLLAQQLGASWVVHEEGLPGRTTVHRDPVEGAHLCGLDAVPVIVGTHTPIDVVVLALGVNDFKTRFAVAADDIARSVESVGQSIIATTTRMAGYPAQLIIIAPPPILETGCLAEFFEGGHEKSQRLPPLLARSARRLGATFIDGGQHVRTSAVDGIHWDEDQHPHLAAAIHTQILSLHHTNAHPAPPGLQAHTAD